MTNVGLKAVIVVFALAPVVCGCGKKHEPAAATAPSATSGPAQGASVDPTPEPSDAAIAAGEAASTPDGPDAHGTPRELVRWTGDFDGMVDRRVVRILTPYSRTFYFNDHGVQRGTAYDIAVMLENTLNKQLKTTSANKLHVVVIPTSRDDLYDSLVQGRGDIVVAGITVTPERERLVDFTVPTKTNVKEIVVTGPGAAELTSLDDLSGTEIAVRERSIQFESLQKLNASFKQQGKAPVRIDTVPATLEDEDILEMVSAGLLKAAITSSLVAEFWQQVLPGITPHPTIVVRDEGVLAWAVRKNSPKLIARLNPVVKAHAEGTLFGNELLRKYLKDTRLLKNATSPEEMAKFERLRKIFQKYGGEYGIDYLLMMAQGYQESRLDQNVKSPVGAIGVMQVMPATGKELKVGDITKLDPNIEAGVKYMRFMIDRYYKDEPMDRLNKGLFTFASYNAGPARIRGLRRDAEAKGLDPNVWFNNVERVAAEKIGRETVTYVSNIYKYYIAYSLMVREMDERAKAKIETAAK
jgi:membrane-bound lytic murein transglycosylase MltF